jgi:hypothetical protein
MPEPNEDPVILIEWDDLKTIFQDIKESIDKRHEVSQHGGSVRILLSLGTIRVGVGIKRTNPPFPMYALDIAKELGHDVTSDGLIIEVKGKDLRKIAEKLDGKYLEWYNKTLIFKKKNQL